ncbi:MAG: carbon starvation protein A [Polyangiaceae bacterium]|nr:carbon starvation protein A [Polyangiaceae bacterium]
MNAAWVCLGGLLTFALGYRFYGRLLARVLFALREDEPVPAHERADGIDFVATKKPVLFGHHYASIAGAAPIIGPAIAVVWGWVPAVLWILIGSVTMGAVHDFSVLVLSIRHRGESVGQISKSVISERARPLFLLLIFVLVMVVIAVFAKAIASLFIQYPGSVLPVNFQIVVAIGIGFFCYKKGVRLLWPSLLALVALYYLIFLGEDFPLSLSPLVAPEAQSLTWIVLLLIYSFVASVIPVWVLLQPRDYINSHQLFVGLFAMIVGVFIAQPQIVAPAFSTPPDDAPSILPFLFVTIACGAISGFHGLVSSGTTSKQLDRATDAPLIGYGSMLGEGLVALLATLAVSAGIADWAGHYHSFAAASSGGIGVFVEGAAHFVEALGRPTGVGQVMIAVMVISFAATSLDTGVRIQRYILSELGGLYGVGFLENRYVAGLFAVLPPLALCISGTEGALWPLFGATNQILAGLSLVVVTVWLYKTGRPILYTLIPMVFVLLVAGASMAGNIARYFTQEKYLLVVVGGIVLGLQLLVVAEGWAAVRRFQRQRSSS